MGANIYDIDKTFHGGYIADMGFMILTASTAPYIEQIQNIVTICKDFFSIILSIITGLCALTGVSYIKALKNKKLEAASGFWIQILSYLLELKNLMGNNRLALDFLYSKDAKNNNENIGNRSNENRLELSDMSQKVLALIMGSNNQIPVCRGWTQRYIKLNELLYDLSHLKDDYYSKWDEWDNGVSRENYYKENIDNLNKMISAIIKYQKDIENKLYPESIFVVFKEKVSKKWIKHPRFCKN